jgi:hypothetical protein
MSVSVTPQYRNNVRDIGKEAARRDIFRQHMGHNGMGQTTRSIQEELALGQ